MLFVKGRCVPQSYLGFEFSGGWEGPFLRSSPAYISTSPAASVDSGWRAEFLWLILSFWSSAVWC